MLRAVAFAAVVVVVVAVVLTGCGPSDACRRYVACQKAFDPSVDVAPYDNGGSCWLTLQTADACTAQCKEALAALAATPGAPAACGANAETDAGPG